LHTNFLIFAVLKQWILQLKETGFSFVLVIFAFLLQRIIRKCRALFQDGGHPPSCIYGTQFWLT